MLRMWFIKGLCLCCCLTLIAAGQATAADAKEDAHTKVKAKLKGKDAELKLDLNNPEDIEKAKRLLESKELQELVTEHDVNLMELRWELGLWTIVVFILLFLILRKMAWGPMLEGLQKREESILGALSEAEKARAEAKTLREQFEKEMAKIGDKSRELMDEARRNAQKLQEEMMAKAKAEIGAERERLLREIGMASDQALKQIWEQTAMLATLVSAKTIKRDLGLEDHRRLVDEAVAELGKTIGDTRRDVWGKNA